MGLQEPSGYENEPVEHCAPLPADLYCTFYDLEMGARLEDCYYYARLLQEHQCGTVLELGCGTGRIVEFLGSRNYRAVGIDNSHEMLVFNHHQRISPMVEMDMCHLGFSQPFDAVIIPHNTLNLINDEKRIHRCLSEIKRTLTKNGLLVIQLFSLTAALTEQAHKRLFQFALFDTGKNGKLVKETIKTYYPETNQLILEERYKIRSYDDPSHNKNYNQIFPLTVYSPSKWLDIIKKSGFNIYSTHSGHNSEGFNCGRDSTLLISAHSL
jgi:SAM-dependent methyltransferase